MCIRDRADSCVLSQAVCPSYECDVDPPILTIADVLDCNGAPLDADVDPEIDGNDAYRAIINFDSTQINLVEPQE